MTPYNRRLYLRYMEIEMTPEQEAQLAQIAARFRAGVRRGIEEADRGDVIDEAQMDALVERLLDR